MSSSTIVGGETPSAVVGGSGGGGPVSGDVFANRVTIERNENIPVGVDAPTILNLVEAQQNPLDPAGSRGLYQMSVSNVGANKGSLIYTKALVDSAGAVTSSDNYLTVIPPVLAQPTQLLQMTGSDQTGILHIPVGQQWGGPGVAGAVVVDGPAIINPYMTANTCILLQPVGYGGAGGFDGGAAATLVNPPSVVTWYSAGKFGFNVSIPAVQAGSAAYLRWFIVRY